ncbi:MAG: metallophosphoesterase [Gemmataceae bacterium]
MPHPDAATPPADAARWRGGFALTALLLVALALLSPLSGTPGHGKVGLLLVLAAVLEFAHGFRRSTAEGQRAAWLGGVVTLAMGVMLLHAIYLNAAAVVLFLSGWFALDGVRSLVGAFRHKGERRSALVWVLAGLGNLGVCAALLAAPRYAFAWAVAIAAACRIFGAASSIALAPVFTPGDSGRAAVETLGLPDSPELQEIAVRITEEEAARARVDRGWIVGFLATLLAIHIGRMGFDRTFLGIMSPGVAVLGDVALGLLLAFLLVIPVSQLWRRLTRPLERRAWGWCLGVPPERRGWSRRVAAAMLSLRLRHTIRILKARYSLPTALSRGLQIGLPLAAVIAATVPVWGMSWYFDTENWASGVWNSWAEARTDTWREAMVAALDEQEAREAPDRAFAVHPPGADGDFSFLVIGDTGEGDASQLSLKAQWLDVVRRPEVKFVVISSDVVYPTGAMRHYEANFWLPFMGTTKPVYAIPGNHDWYDALEGFNATFLTPDAARVAMRARVEVDRQITSTTDRRIDQLIDQASRYRELYRVPTQQQRAPFFQVQTPSFALLALDTGVARRLDPKQEAWARSALESAKDKFKMVILGHPIYAGGVNTAEGDDDFTAIHQMLQKHDVPIVMAGDTHDLEYYAERDASRTAHHFVNGGGGAYLSFGTSLAWPAKPATQAWAYYPTKGQVSAKISVTKPWWKAPAWWWTTRLGAWPFSAEWLSAMFDANVAPFFQSFVEVRVEPSRRQVRVIPYGVFGRLRWSDMAMSPEALPPGSKPDSPAEWVVKMPPR